MHFDLTAAENLSNVAWLVFAFASVALWRRLVLPGLGWGIRRSLFALVCFLIFMFPVISISDDLHPDLVIAAEGDGKSKRLLVAAEQSGPQISARAHSPALCGCVLRALGVPQLVLLARLAPVVPASPAAGAPRCRRGRAPPAFIPA